MLYLEVGGTGYDFAIATLDGEYPELYAKLVANIKGIQDETK